MPLPLPRSLSPSKVSSFKDCALAFRFSAIDHLPEAPSAPAVKGTLVHAALEELFWSYPPGHRSREAASACLDDAWSALVGTEDFVSLDLSPEESQAFRGDAERLVENVFLIEDPDGIDAAATELTLEADVDGVRLRGIIDRLDRTEAGGFVVTDYKTGRVPRNGQEQGRMAGVHFYAMLCQEILGERPERVQLLYLRGPTAITAEVSESSIRSLRRRTSALWKAIERACETEDFRPSPSGLCSWCSFKPLCPIYAEESAPGGSDH
jgi:putative RecB family exonuclease